jgi:integrase
MLAREFDSSNRTLGRTLGRRQWQFGTKIETIAEMLGHESIDMTRKYHGINLSDQDEPMKAQDEYVRRLCGTNAQRGTFPSSQMKWWAQGDLDS